MKIKLIDYGYEHCPLRAHYNDAGADVYSPDRYIVHAHETVKIPLKFGLMLPDGIAAFVFSRSSLSAKGIVCELPPIDSGYRGEIHAVVTNVSSCDYCIEKDDRIGQLVCMPVIVAEFSEQLSEYDERDTAGFGSSGK